jgi:hypothetical protein
MAAGEMGVLGGMINGHGRAKLLAPIGDKNE